jgi:outer membrane receptor protein involved in Fe transport
MTVRDALRLGTRGGAAVLGRDDLGQLAPGVQINYGGNSLQPAIRGITTLTTGNGVENNVAIYVDGFYEASTTAINSELLNIASIEVLKGPQGTLYGRNATGGAILINTLAPSNVWTGKFQGKYGNFDDATVSGYVSGPLASNIRFAAGGFYRESDGWSTDEGIRLVGGWLGRRLARSVVARRRPCLLQTPAERRREPRVHTDPVRRRPPDSGGRQSPYPRTRPSELPGWFLGSAATGIGA